VFQACRAHDVDYDAGKFCARQVAEAHAVGLLLEIVDFVLRA